MDTYNKHNFYKIILSYIVGDYTYEDTFFVYYKHAVTYETCKKTVEEDYIGYSPKKHLDADNYDSYPHRCVPFISYADSNDVDILKKYHLVSTVNNQLLHR